MNSVPNGKFTSRPRTVLYEELAEYYYNSVAIDRLKDTNIQNEVLYHVRNVVLLTLYFDAVVITSATIFNARNVFVSKVISTFLEHVRVREMIQLGALKIVGWGSNDATGMLDAATDYAGSVLGINKETTVLAQLGSLFTDETVISRSPLMPDADLAQKYMDRLSRTTFVSNQGELQKVFDVVQRQYDQTGSLIAIEMLPGLDRAVISKELLNRSKLELFGVTIEHMRGELPDLWVYSPFMASTFYVESTQALQGGPRAFLLSPMIFGSFLSLNIDPKTFALVMRQSYKKLDGLKNGDWRKFVEAYHQAVLEISDAISLGMHLSPEEFQGYDAKVWAEKVLGKIETSGRDLDIATFVESLGSLGGVVLGVPGLQPVAKIITTALGDRLLQLVHRLGEKKRSQVSPFILKLEKAYIT